MTIYLVCIALVSIAFYRYAMSFEFIVMGVVFVGAFFLLSTKYTTTWMKYSRKTFLQNVFWIALVLRVVWVIFSYFYYKAKTGIPFEFECADSLGYYEEAKWLRDLSWHQVVEYYNERGVSDSGYGYYLTTLYKLIGPSIIITRLLKAVYSSLTILILFNLTDRVLGEKVARMAAIFAMLMPNLIIYCGMHLKETEMLFLIVWFLDRADAALRNKKLGSWTTFHALLLGGILFSFRTVLGMVALFSFATALLFSPTRVVRKGRKFMVAVWLATGVAMLAGGTIMTEVQELLEDKDDNQTLKRLEQTSRGNQWAQYATGTVLAPMMFVMPFSTMVDTDQNNQCVIHGGNFVRNYMGVFVLVAIYVAVFRKKTWKELSLIGAFVVGYLGVLSLSGFANSERFLLPALPGLIVMWAYGISELDRITYRLSGYWPYVVILMEVGWAFFKIGSRGLF